jgi:hypothetical protein
LRLTADRIEARRKHLVTVLVSKDSNLADSLSAFDSIEQEK